jgi:hypothetical protein
MKNNKKFKLVFILLGILILSCGSVYAVQNDSISKAFGIKHAEILASVGDESVATIDGEKITKKGFETYKFLVNSGEQKLSDSEMLNKIIDRQVIYKSAQRDGITVTDEEVLNAIHNAKDIITSDAERYKSFQDYIEGLNMTEEQYWESVKPVYKKALICGKYKNELKQKYKEENNITDKAELDSKFKPFFDDKVKELKSKMKIEVNK